MGSEIFKLKSLYMDDTVVRGTRVSILNAKETKTLLTNPGDDPVVKTGETGVNEEYLIQSSLIANDLKGFGTFTHNSPVVTGYTGPQDLKHSDIIRLDSDATFYTVTGIQGTDVYLTDKYVKATVSTPPMQSGPATVRKVKLNSVEYETTVNTGSDTHIYYDRNKSSWGVTGIQPVGPTLATDAVVDFSTGMQIEFLPGSSASKPDLLTVGTLYKTVVDNNPTEVSDVSLSPLPYPHESLKVFVGTSGGEMSQKVDGEDYVVNYTQNPEYKTPRPPYEERQGAYLKFLGRLTDEPEVSPISSTFEGRISLTKKSTLPGGTSLLRPVSSVIPNETFKIKVNGIEKRGNADYIAVYDAGLVTFVKHRNSEHQIDTVLYPKRLTWDGVSVIKSVGQDQVKDPNNLVIPGQQGLPGVTGMAYYEDTDQNNLARDTDYLFDPESGAVSFTQPLKDSESVLVSYYVQGDEVSAEAVALDDMRTNKYPVISGSVAITEKYNVLEDNKQVTKTRVLVEGQDYSFSYITGRITLLNLSGSEDVLSLEATYTPLAQINCILQSISGDALKYRMTIVDDIVKVVSPDALVFKVNNPVVSVPAPVIFKSDVTTSNYTFSGSIIAGSLSSVKNESATEVFDTTGYKYDDLTKQITLDTSLSKDRPEIEEMVVATYSFESETLPYAAAVILNTIYNDGDDHFIIEGFDRTDVLKTGMTIRIDNFDPENTYYYKIKSVVYRNGSTTVSLYGTFPEMIINPTFYLFDDEISWQDLPDGTTVDKSIAVRSEAIALKHNLLEIKRAIKPGSMLMVNDQQVYSVVAVAFTADEAIVSIFPGLQYRITGSVKYSSLPVHQVGDTQLDPQYFALLDPTQPAFKLSYLAPSGFEGSAKILVDPEKIMITESIRGIMNPVPYTYTIANYADVYTLAKSIQATASTFRVNVPGSNVPDYNPFTISPPGSVEEDYYLGDGSWSADLIIPFEQDTPVSLPYIFQIVPELFKWSLLQTYAYQSSFAIKEADRTSMFTTGNLLAFRNKIDGTVYFYEVQQVSLVPNPDDSTKKDTVVALNDTFRVNMLDPTAYKYDTVSWQPVINAITNIDKINSTVTFNGTPANNLRTSSMLKIADRYIYQVIAYTQDVSSFTLKLSPSIDANVRMETYHGYVKQSLVPVYLDEPSPQPYMSISYTAPKEHTGSAKIVVAEDKIELMETVDNFILRTTELLYSKYSSLVDLAAAITDVVSCVGTYHPFTAIIPDVYVGALKHDNFDNYKLQGTDGVKIALPTNVPVVVSSFEIQYTVPTGYTGKAEVLIRSDSLVLKETIYGYNSGQDATNEITISYQHTPSLVGLALNVIPSVASLVSGGGNPYSCTILNSSLFDQGLWSSTHVVPISADYVETPVKVMGRVDSAYWYALGPLNERRLKSGTDYEVETGAVTLTKAIAPLDRYRFSYMGLWDLAEFEGTSVTCSCRYFSTLPAGSRVDVYMDYLNIDQFYLQKLTERKFSEIVVSPQVQELLVQKGGSGGQSSDNGSDSNSTPNYAGGITDLYYALRDEEIKKQLYLRFYEWYKQRLRDFSAELQLTDGFKFGHSNAVGIDGNGQYTLVDDYVETEDYTLTSDDDIAQINNGFSKFFPVGYEGQSPKYYDRFGTEYLDYNDVYCCNITTTVPGSTKVTTLGYIKADNPYWAKGSDFVVWSDASVDAGKNLVGPYAVGVPVDDRTFPSGTTYSFLKRIEKGAKVRINGFENYYEIADIVPSEGKDYEYLVLKGPFTQGLKQKNKRGIRTFKGNPVDFTQLMDALPNDGYNIYVKRQSAEPFPMMDDHGNLGATAIGTEIEGQVTNTRRIKKPSLKLLLAILFPAALLLPEKPKKFRIMVKKDSEGAWEPLYPDTSKANGIDLAKLTFKEERNVDDVMDALRYDFVKKYDIPIIPPPPPPLASSIPIYDIEEHHDDQGKIDQGYRKYFYLSFERVYDAEASGGYYEGIVIRAKNKEWWFQVVDGVGTQSVVGEYGFDPSNTYKNFYDPDNIYKSLLKEKQAWETEELIIKDLYDHSDKIARGFDQGNLNIANSKYQSYLASQSLPKKIVTTFTVITDASGTVSDSVSTGADVPSGIFVTVSSTGALPTPLTPGTVYYTVSTGDNKCRFVTLYSNGQVQTDINLTDTGKGTHTLTQVNPAGISDILAQRIPAYERQLLFLIDAQGPVYHLLYPDLVHPEDSASQAIATTFRQTTDAWSLYNRFYQKEQFFKTLNHDNNITWRNDYVRWALGLEPGLIYQLEARQMYDANAGALTVGLQELHALNIRFAGNLYYTVKNATVSVSADYSGKYVLITCDIISVLNPSVREEGVNIRFNLYKTETIGGIDTILSRTLDEMCDLINARKYGPQQVALFVCTNEFIYHENNVTSNMLMVSGLAIDPVVGALLRVTTVSDHRDSDPRVLFLDRNIKDRVYTHGVREMPAFNLSYLGNYYTTSTNEQAILIESSKDMVESFSFRITLDNNSKKLLEIIGWYSLPFRLKHGILDSYDFHISIPMYDSATGSYITLNSLIQKINDYEDTTVQGILAFHDVHPVSASLLYNVSPFGELLTGTAVYMNQFEDAVSSGSSLHGTMYVHPVSTLDSIPASVNQAIYRVYYDTDLTKKLEIKFNEVIVNGSVVSPSTSTSTVFTFNLQNSDLSYKTLSQVCSEISADKYKQTYIFSASPVYEENPPGSALSTQYVVTNNDPMFLGFDQVATIYADTVTVNINDPISARSVLNTQNAYYSFPLYTSNGNPRKEPINGIPVSGTWDVMPVEKVLTLGCTNGDTWEVTFNDYESGAEKSFKPSQTIITKIDTEGVLTQEEFNSIKDVQDEPAVSMIKELVLTRDKDTHPKTITISLRKNDTIKKVVEAITAGKFNADGKETEDPSGIIQPYFTAALIGDPNVQGEYKSYELQATYLPIIRTFTVPGSSPELKENYLIGWELATQKFTVAQKGTLSMSTKRYSHRDTYKFSVNSPDVAYTNTLSRNPQGFRKDTLAFDIYCWDSSGYYEVKNNWIYFRSGNVGYSAGADLGQPDKVIGIGIPLAGSGHSVAPGNESLIDLINRINAHPIVSKWFYANLRFTRTGTTTPGFFEYGYLPDFHAIVPQSVLDDIKLRDDDVISIGPGAGYSFVSSAYQVYDITNTIDLSCDWRYTYEYEATYDFNSLSLDTITKLAGKINTDLAPQIGASLFEANIVGTHGADDSTDLLTNSGNVSEIDETFVANVPGDYLQVSRSDWRVNDILRVSSTGSLPSPLVAGTNYYVTNVSQFGGFYQLTISATFGGLPLVLTTSGTGIHTVHRRYVDLNVGTVLFKIAALQLRVRNASGVNYVISNPTFEIPVSRTSLTLRCSILYNHTFSVSGLDHSTQTMSELVNTLSSLVDYPDAIFGPLFAANIVNGMYDTLQATRLKDAVGYSIPSGTKLAASLGDLVSMRLLNMLPQANITVSLDTFTVIGIKTFSSGLPGDRDLHTWIGETIRGDYTQKMIDLDVLPIKVDSIYYGLPAVTPQTQLYPGNQPAHVYFGILGDIQWIQISDYNLHIQLNYIKERLAKPWTDSSGSLLYDYYTPEQFNTRPGYDNQTAIDMDNFLGYMRTTRYNQIKNSVVNEAVVQNKYFWLYMKFHREFGCDQRVKALKKLIAEKEKDSETIGLLL